MLRRLALRRERLRRVLPCRRATSAAAASKTIASATAAGMAAVPALPGLDPASVAAQLFSKAHTFDFFQAVRLLEKLFPDTMPVGFDGPPGRETVRFRSHVSLIFPPSQIWELRPTDGDRSVPEMSVAFLRPGRAPAA